MQAQRIRSFRGIHRLVPCALAGLLAAFGLAHAQDRKTDRIFIGYYESWLADVRDDANVDETLARLPTSINVVNLAFMRPDARYIGSLSLPGTGLEFQYDGMALRNSISKLKQRSPNVKVFVSVGGQHDTNWADFSPDAITWFVRDFGLDGVDIDFEPTSTECRQIVDRIKCGTDDLLLRSVRAIRTALPAPVMLSLTANSTGAFGEGLWKNAEPKGGSTYGMLLALLRDRRASGQVDFLNIMAYDAGSKFDPLEAYDAFQHYFRNRIIMGFTPPPESWGDHSYSPSEVKRILRAALRRGAAGAMLFSLRKALPAPSQIGQLSPLVDVISRTLSAN